MGGDGEEVTYDVTSDPQFANVKFAPPPCSGEPCEGQGMCRSKWGSCGTGSNFCNDDSLWIPECSDATTTGNVMTSTTAGVTTVTATATVATTTSIAATTVAPPTTTEHAGDTCTGKPCDKPWHTSSMCRSKWGHCGATADHCNDDSLWCGSDASGCKCAG